MNPIKPNPNIFQWIRNDRDPINPLETSGTYKIEYEKEAGKRGSCIGMSKRKIKNRIKKHQNDIKFEKFNVALAQFHKKKMIKIDFKNVRKIAQY